jgi:vacuolar protein sorting-associated protein VTA1
MYALQKALKLDSKSKEAKMFLGHMMDELEKSKMGLKTTDKYEAVTNEMVAQAHVENYGMILFDKADAQDRALQADMKTVRTYHTASQIFEVLSVFKEEVSPEIGQRSKYAKWRALTIMKALKNNEPVPPPENRDEPEEPSGDLGAGGTSGYPQPPDAGFSAPPANYMPQPPNNVPDNLGYGTPIAPKVEPVDPRTLVSHPSAEPCSSSKPAEVLSSSGSSLSPANVMQAQKYCKFANSSLQYSDVTTAIDFLEKALYLLKTGHE